MDNLTADHGVADRVIAPQGAVSHRETADLVVTAEHIETFDPRNPTATAIAIRGDRIAAVGQIEQMGDLIDKGTRIIEFGGGAVLPGLTDSHIHPVWGVTEFARGIDLSEAATLEQAVDLLAHAEPLGEERWLLGWGVDPNIFETPMNGGVFESLLPGRPVYVRMRDVHSAVLSPRAIELAGITGRETFADKSQVALGDDGQPSGLLLELSAMALVDEVIPARDVEEIVQDVHEFLNVMADVGLTAGHVMDFNPGAREILEAVEDLGDLPVRLRISPMCHPGSTPTQWQELADLQGSGGRHWRIEGIKFFIDGTVDNGTAWLEEPDVYGENVESIWTDPNEYARALRFFIERNIPTATHAIGDAGVRHALDAIEAAGGHLSSTPHRIEHIETVPDDIIDRFAQLGVVASMQPIHGTRHTLADGSDNWSVRLGQERASRGWRCRDLRDHGVTVALGSDWPVTPVDPRAMMADAQLRRPVDRPDWAPVQPEQALSARQAYEGYTTHAARAAGHEGERGRIAPGFLADLTVLAASPLSLEPAQQAANEVVATVLGGRVRYSRVTGKFRFCG